MRSPTTTPAVLAVACEPGARREGNAAVIKPGPNPAAPPPLQAVIDRWDKRIRYLAYQEVKRWGFQTQPLDCEDLVHHGFLHLITLYRGGRIDWDNPGVNRFLELSLVGHLRNTLQSLKPQAASISKPVSREDGDGPEVEGMAGFGSGAYEDPLVIRSILHDVQEFVDHLPRRDLLIFICRVLDGRSLEATARVLDTSRESIRRKEKAVCSEMRQFLGRKGWELCDWEEFL
jgi:RNA polymerase sigma factor (sigma-70 family)